MGKELGKSGIDVIGEIPWGTHICQFYKTREDLIEILVPYFKAGLENNEFCLWITSESLDQKGAEEAMRKAVADFDRYLETGQIEIMPYTEWYLKDGALNLQRVLNGWIDKLTQAHSKGYDSLRATGNADWLEKTEWQDFEEYEREINDAIGKHKMIAICTYSLDKCGASEIIDVVSNHQFALIRQDGKWKTIESSEHKRMDENIRRRLKFEKTIAAISSQFVGIHNTDEAINNSLACMGQLGRADRAYLFLLRDGQKMMDNTHEWCADGVSRQIDNLKNLPCDRFPWWFSLLNKGKIIHIEDVSKLPAEAKEEGEILVNQNIKSLLVLPVYTESELAGFIGFDDVKDTGKWDENDLGILRMAAEVIGRGLVQKQTEESLQRARDELEAKVAERTAELEALNKQLRSMASQLSVAEEYERRRIAALLHNGVTQTLSLCNLRLGALVKKVPSKVVVGDIQEILYFLEEAIEETRSLISQIGSPLLKEHGLEAALYDLVKKMRSQHGIVAHFKDDTEPKPLDEDVSILLFQAVRELLLNVVKHAKASRLWVSTKRQDRNIQITVEDDGVGFDASDIISGRKTSKGFGLFSIRERLCLIGGNIAAESKRGRGTRITLVAPMSEAVEQDEIAGDVQI